MGGLSRWAVRKPWAAIAAWFVLVAIVFTLGGKFGGKLNDSFSLPDTESLRATELLAKLPSGQASEATTATANILWSPAKGSAVDATSAAAIVPVLTTISKLPGVSCVTNPFDKAGQGLGATCPKPQSSPIDPTTLPAAQAAVIQAALVAAQKAYSPVSPDGTVAKSVVTFAGAGDGTGVPTQTAKDIIADIKAANGVNGMQVGANGQVLSFAGQEPPSSEGIGLTVALIILLIAFGSLLAAGLPLVTAGFGVALGGTLLLYIARFMDVATFAPTLASMIGLGVGIDYSLFVINRFRQGILAGHDSKQAATEAVNTSGRAVVFAASTVVIALLGLFIMRISFFNGLALAASGTVIMVMLAAVWLLPAMLSLLGDRAVSPVSRFAARAVENGRYGVPVQIGATIVGLALLGSSALPSLAPAAKGLAAVIGIVALVAGVGPWFYKLTRQSRAEGAHAPEGAGWAHYARALQKHPVIPAILSIGAVLALAIPALSLRLGFPDDSGTPPGSITRIAYDLTSKGFGPGANGPFFVAVQLPKNGDVEGLGQIIGALTKTEGVAAVNPSLAMLPLVGPSLKDQSVTAVMVQPTTGPQDEATQQLLDRLRTETLPAVDQKTGAQAYVGGTTAITADFSSVMKDAMPLFLAVVVGLGFLMLMILFRAPVVSLTAVVTSLLSFAASTGITVAVFQWGWLNNLLGVTGTGPIFPFLPVMVFAILFGLSMDYHVFLVSRMQEEWTRTGDNATSVRRGLAGSGRVVLMAALIMASVFAAFIPTPNNTIKLFGVALASAVLVDAFLIRLVFVPAFMSILGKGNWWLPGWLDKILPHFQVEGAEDEIADDPDLEAEKVLV